METACLLSGMSTLLKTEWGETTDKENDPNFEYQVWDRMTCRGSKAHASVFTSRVQEETSHLLAHLITNYGPPTEEQEAQLGPKLRQVLHEAVGSYETSNE